MESYDILVIILATALAVFMILAIVVAVLLIQFVRKLNDIGDKAESLVNNVETASKFFSKSAGPIALSRIVANVVDMMKDKKK